MSPATDSVSISPAAPTDIDEGSVYTVVMRGVRMIDNKRAHRVELEIVRGQAQQRLRPVLGPAFLIGSSCECDLVLGTAKFAEVYACVIVRPGGVTVRQVGDGPRMLINGRPAADAKLRDGDRLVTGAFEFIVHISPRADASVSSAAAIEPRPASRWRSAQQAGAPDAMRDVAQLIHDIRAATQKRPAMKRPA
jgi:hypothetical protein